MNRAILHTLGPIFFANRGEDGLLTRSTSRIFQNFSVVNCCDRHRSRFRNRDRIRDTKFPSVPVRRPSTWAFRPLMRPLRMHTNALIAPDGRLRRCRARRPTRAARRASPDARGAKRARRAFETVVVRRERLRHRSAAKARLGRRRREGRKPAGFLPSIG